MIYVIFIKHAKFCYSLIEFRLLPSAPACSNKFHALAVYLHPIFTAPFQLEAHLESSGTSAVELFCRNSPCLQAIGYFCRRAPLQMFDRILNVTLSNNSLQLAGGLWKRFYRWGYIKESGLTLHPNSLDLHQAQKQKIKSWTDPASSFCFPETVQVFSNPTPITQSSINPKQNKNQTPLA